MSEPLSAAPSGTAPTAAPAPTAPAPTASEGQLDRLFAPRWAGGWALTRVLFAAAALDAHLERIQSVSDALAVPTMVLSTGPAHVSDHVLLGTAAAWALWAVGLLGVAALGWGGRVAKPGLLVWFASHAGLMVLCGLNVRAPERLIVWVTLGLLLGPIGERDLVRKARAPVGRWFLLVVFASLYGSTGWMKLLEEPAWWTGDTLPYDLVDRFHSGGAIAAWLSGQHALCTLLGWGTIAFEATFPFLIGFAELSPFVLLAGVAMHVTIGILMDIGPLGTVAMATYPVLVDPDVGRRLYLRGVAAWGRAREKRGSRA